MVSQPQNSELVNYNSFSEVFSVLLKTIDALNLKLLSFCMHTACFKFWISKVQDFRNFELPSMGIHFSWRCSRTPRRDWKRGCVTKCSRNGRHPFDQAKCCGHLGGSTNGPFYGGVVGSVSFLGNLEWKLRGQQSSSVPYLKWGFLREGRGGERQCHTETGYRNVGVRVDLQWHHRKYRYGDIILII